MKKSKEKEALEIEAAIEELEPADKVEGNIDILLKVKGKLTYPQLSEWLNTEIAGVTIKGNKTDNDMRMIIHVKDGGAELTLKAFGGSSDDIRIPSIMKDYILFREWYSRLDTEPCVDILVYNDKSEEFALILVDIEYQMLIFPGFIWAAPIKLVDDWLAKRAENTYKTTFEFSDVAAWLNHEITNKDLQPGLILNYRNGPSICISGAGASKSKELWQETDVSQKWSKKVKEKGE